MKFNSDIHHRRSIRLKKYDYSLSGFYFVTICTKDRQCLFGEIIGGEMILSELGKIILEELLKTPNIRQNVRLDYFIIMPNHLHVIIVINDNEFDDSRGTVHRAPTFESFGKPVSGSIPTIIRSFKAAVTNISRQRQLTYDVWQRNYYEHIIRDEKDLHNIQGYILGNVSQWQADLENLQLYKHWTEREREYFVQKHYDELFGDI